MDLLDGADAAELGGELREALFLGLFRHAFVHIGPLEIFALGSRGQVCRRVADPAELLKPKLGMLLLVIRCLQEKRRDLLEALLLGSGCKIGVLVARLGLARKGLPEILLGLGTGIFVGHNQVSLFE